MTYFSEISMFNHNHIGRGGGGGFCQATHKFFKKSCPCSDHDNSALRKEISLLLI